MQAPPTDPHDASHPDESTKYPAACNSRCKKERKKQYKMIKAVVFRGFSLKLDLRILTKKLVQSEPKFPVVY